MGFVNSKKQGDMGLGAAIAWFAEHGRTVCVPLTDSQDFDLVVTDESGALQRVQVKTTGHRAASGHFKASLRVHGGNRSGTGKIKHFDSASVDFVFVVTLEGDRYLIPAKECNRHSITLNEDFEQFQV